MKPALEILCYPDPRLRRKCVEVTEFGQELRSLGEAMLEVMAQADGVGLAGPQVGVCQRIFVCTSSAEREDKYILINPRLSDLEGRVVSEEGCLSIPEVNVKVPRAQRCRLLAQTPEGTPVELSGEGLQARIWQHEFDHLDGRLIVDYMDEADKLANRRAIKHLEQTYRGPRR